MLRPPSPTALADLRAAATASDAELDLALLRIGVLAPARLDEIRAILAHPGVSLAAATNTDGHCIIEIGLDGDRAALLHHDGCLEALLAAA
jgi:hypothetical protein